MEKIEFLEPIQERGKIWLPVRYGDRVISFLYPPVQGTHEECFHTLNQDQEVIPADGVELALIARGAYTQNAEEWQDVRKNCFEQNGTRAPVRLVLTPEGYFPKDKRLSGVLVEKELNGNDLKTTIKLMKPWNSLNYICLLRLTIKKWKC